MRSVHQVGLLQLQPLRESILLLQRTPNLALEILPQEELLPLKIGLRGNAEWSAQEEVPHSEAIL